ncbi:MAG: PorT family protein, partial [Tannerellaceae bacterium]|nr:PorT family protein [Tannerellaceae bacterium]
FGIGADAAIVYSNKNGGQIEAPIHGKWKVGIPMAKLFLATGPYFGFPLSGNEVKEEVKETLHSLKTKSFQMGWDFGGGVELLKHLQVGLNYSLGLTDNYNEQTVDAAKLLKGKDRGWSLTAAWLF